ncbi:MAG: hypothetical protein KatS3mg108_0242 [Isosphaeraceae bacterium]|jgi:2',3'-cyclic-nucleotide 2'-phosphodiesterase (5'-nucleotidase family)|nr:MAG: hypothetical protein KatS3mg108_0242 [Isosphaeraceae bacterium]
MRRSLPRASRRSPKPVRALTPRRRAASRLIEPLEPRQLLSYTLQILHASDLEGGVDAIARAANFAAIVDALEDSYPNSITLSAGDNYIPGPFFSAAGDPTLRGPLRSVTGNPQAREDVGRVDAAIMNAIGFDASALGNHEFDAGPATVATIIGPDIRDANGDGTLDDARWLGTQFPYLSANLDFSAEPSLARLATSDLLPNTAFVSPLSDLPAAAAAKKIAPATLIERGGQTIGVIGVTTPLLASISSPGNVRVQNPGAGTNDMAALATILQPIIDQVALHTNKIILVSHLQQFALEQDLAPRLSKVDIILAGGSSTLLADPEDVARGLQPGDSPHGSYPFLTTNADGDPVALVSVGDEYRYVGRLVVTFDSAGVIDPASIDPNVSGAFASTTQTVAALWGTADPFAPGSKGDLVRTLTTAVQNVVTAKDSIRFGRTGVYLNGLRQDVRTQETNLGNLTADANLAAARSIDPTVVVSLKNGGGIRDSIGTIAEIAPGLYQPLPPQANPLSGKQTGEISQLDIENSLRFNNQLSLLTLTADGLRQILEHGVAATRPGATPGQFPQVGGLAFSFDPSRPPGSRVRSAAIVDDQGRILDTLVQNGQTVGNPNRPIRVVTLNFLAAGGDSYPFPSLGSNRVDLGIGEQTALANFLADRFPLGSLNAFAQPDTPPDADTRIQNLAVRADTVLDRPIELAHLATRSLPNGAEIVAHDPLSQRLFVIGGGRFVDVLTFANPAAPQLLFSLDLGASFAGNSVAIHNGLVAVAASNALDPQLPGAVFLFNADGTLLNQLEVGAVPDMLTFTPDGTTILVANEGEPRSDYSFDPEGSVSIIHLAGGPLAATVSTARFDAFIGREAELRAQGIRIYGPGSNAAQDFEPEYITVTPDSARAFVTLQENNAIAELDLSTGQFTRVLPLGTKDHNANRFLLDTFEFSTLPTLGTTAAGQPVPLGGFSGLAFEGINPANGRLKFLTHTDRGPNGEAIGNLRPFLLPNFTPELIRFELDPASRALTITQRIPLKRQDGSPLTGLPNTAISGGTASTPYNDEVPIDLTGNTLPLDPLGADLEGIAIDPADGSLWMVDEYRPAIYHFDPNGTLLNRYVPAGTAFAARQPAGSFGIEALPAVLAQRRQNRGFEAITIHNGKIYAFVQSPLRNPASLANSTLNAMRNIRIVELDPTTQSTRQFLYVMDNPNLGGSTNTRADKIGDAAVLPSGEFLVIERDDDTILDDDFAKVEKKIYRFRLDGATDITPWSSFIDPVSGKSIDQMTPAELAAAGIQPIAKSLHVDLNAIGYNRTEKVEGLAVIDAHTLAVVNDNDFTVAGITIDFTTGRFTPDPDPEPTLLGLIRTASNALDPSDRDGPANSGRIQIAPWPVEGLYMPDALASYQVGNLTYIVTANEGDAREYDALSEEVRVNSLNLDPSRFPNAAALKANAALGRLTVSNVDLDLDGDGDADRLQPLGARSFTIWVRSANGSLTPVFDSGDDFEQITARAVPTLFNSNGTPATFDTRSDNKGPEPEGIVLGTLNGRTYAFIGLERTGGVMVYDVSDPYAPTFVQYINTAGDLAPEGLTFIPASDSPTGAPILLVTNEVSRTLTAYAINAPGGFQTLPNLAGSEGSPITFTVSGSPGLTYSLGPDAPPDASIHPTTGAFSWTPSNGPETQSLTLFATDGTNLWWQTLTASITNAAPVFTSISSPATTIGGAIQGALTSISATFFDPGTLDTHTATVNWGDGTITTASLSAGSLFASHTYSAGGSYTATITLTDSDGASTTQSLTLYITGASLRNGTLEVIGTTGDDNLRIIEDTPATVRVRLPGAFSTPFLSFPKSQITRIIARLGDGNDLATVARRLTTPLLIDAGAGHDVLTAGGGPAILIGGDGNDSLLANSSPAGSLLIGGDGADSLLGSTSSDLLIAGSTDFDTHDDALFAILEHWNASGSLHFLDENTNVYDDNAIDLIRSRAGADLLFINPDTDQVDDLSGRDRIRPTRRRRP